MYVTTQPQYNEALTVRNTVPIIQQLLHFATKIFSRIITPLKQIVNQNVLSSP